jgi:hypothetical protein
MDYLISTAVSATATELSAILEGGESYDQVTQFLSKREYNSKERLIVVDFGN